GEIFSWVPMPYRLVQDNFLVRMVRRPDRLNVFLSVPMALLVGHSVLFLLGRVRQKGVQVALTAVFTALLLLDYAPVPFATTPMRVPAWHANLSDQPGEFGIYDLPTNSRSYDKTYMMYQIFHGRALVNGHISRTPQEALAFTQSTPFLAQLHRDNQMDLEITDVTRQLQVLADADVPYLVMHKPFAHAGLLSIWQDWLIIEPHYEDDELIVYKTDPQFGADFGFAQPLTDELGMVRVAAVPTEGVVGGNLKVDIRWGASAAPSEAYDLCLQLWREEVVQAEQCQPLSSWPTSEWGASELVRGFYRWSVPDLPEGAYRLTAVLQAASGEKVGNTAVLGDLTLTPYAPDQTTDARWNDQIHLSGYALGAVNEAGQLPLTLYWQTTAPLETSYKVFVHLVDGAGQVVAQSDAIPRNWAYPTTAWDVGEVVRDVVLLDVGAVPPGEYGLRVGLYEANTAVRLAGDFGGDVFDLGRVTLD
ncbi:MAG: hypothetical protein KDD89_14770, partial [Anaerolineales bacterium]|nr:hypothetical protein [Anaerolineales bacterium]